MQESPKIMPTGSEVFKMSTSLPQLTYLVLLLLSTVALRPSFSLPQGPPVDQHFDRVCSEMAPLHGSNNATPGNGGFFIQTDLPRDGYRGFNYTAGQSYTGIYTHSAAAWLIILLWRGIEYRPDNAFGRWVGNLPMRIPQINLLWAIEIVGYHVSTLVVA